MEKISAAARIQMQKLADFIEADDRIVAMEAWFGRGEVPSRSVYLGLAECGTVCCAAGHVVAMNVKKYRNSPAADVFTFARKILKLDEDQASALFMPYGYSSRSNKKGDIQKQRLLEVLRGERKLTRCWLTRE